MFLCRGWRPACLSPFENAVAVARYLAIARIANSARYQLNYRHRTPRLIEHIVDGGNRIAVANVRVATYDDHRFGNRWINLHLW